MAESVEVVKSVLDATNRADFAAVIESLSDDVEFDYTSSRGPMSQVFHGRDGVQEFLTSFFEPFASVTFELEEAIELEIGWVMTVTTVRVRGDGSGAPVAAKGAALWTVRDGKVAALKMYQSKDEALEAASAEG